MKHLPSLALGLASAFISCATEASTIRIDATRQGALSSLNAHSGHDNYLAGWCAEGCGLWRDYFYFDVPTLSAPVTAAKLVVNNAEIDMYGFGYSGITYQIRSLESPKPSYAKLGKGTKYGSVHYTSPSQSFEMQDIPLDSAALAQIADGGLTFGIGGEMTYPTFLTSEYPVFVFGLSGGYAAQLVLTTGVVATMPTLVPEPSTWAMLTVGFAGLGVAGYRSSKRLRLAARCS
jgi:large repetitive protein